MVLDPNHTCTGSGLAQTFRWLETTDWDHVSKFCIRTFMFDMGSSVKSCFFEFWNISSLLSYVKMAIRHVRHILVLPPYFLGTSADVGSPSHVCSVAVELHTVLRVALVAAPVLDVVTSTPHKKRCRTPGPQICMTSLPVHIVWLYTAHTDSTRQYIAFYSIYSI
jgi:hypothetical protein